MFVFVLILLQLRLDRSAVDKESRFPPCRTGSKHQIVWTGFGSSSLRTEPGFERTERVQPVRTKQVADGRTEELLLAWTRENVAAAAAVADFPSLVLLDTAAGQASHITSYAHGGQTRRAGPSVTHAAPPYRHGLLPLR